MKNKNQFNIHNNAPKLQAMGNSSSVDQSDPRFVLITNKQFLKLFHTSQGTSRRWRKGNQIPFVQIGRRIYFCLADVQEFIAKHTISPGCTKR